MHVNHIIWSSFMIFLRVSIGVIFLTVGSVTYSMNREYQKHPYSSEKCDERQECFREKKYKKN